MSKQPESTKLLIAAQLALIEKQHQLALEIRIEALRMTQGKVERLINDSKNVVRFPTKRINK